MTLLTVSMKRIFDIITAIFSVILEVNRCVTVIKSSHIVNVNS